MKKLLFFIFLLSTNSFCQSYQADLTNGYQTSEREFEFDITVRSTNEFLITAYQVAVRFNTKIGTGITYEMITGSCELSNPPLPNTIKLYSDSILAFGSAQGYDLISEQKRMGRFRIKSTTPFTFNLPEVRWVFLGNVNTIITGEFFADITSKGTFKNLEYDIPLPVTLIYFTTRLNGDSLIAEWETASEINTYGFKLMRASSQDSEFVQVGFVPASGNSNGNKFYRCIDSLSLAGTYKYYLRILDLGGREEKTQTEFVTYKGNDIQQPPPKSFTFLIIGVCVFIALAILIAISVKPKRFVS